MSKIKKQLKERTSISVDSDVLSKVKKYAYKNNMSVSEAFERIAAHFLNVQKRLI